MHHVIKVNVFEIKTSCLVVFFSGEAYENIEWSLRFLLSLVSYIFPSFFPLHEICFIASPIASSTILEL